MRKTRLELRQSDFQPTILSRYTSLHGFRPEVGDLLSCIYISENIYIYNFIDIFPLFEIVKAYKGKKNSPL